MSQGTKQFPTRIPVALHAALAAAATENNRSLNAEVIYRLDQTFQENHDCPPVAVDLLVTAAANAVATVVTEVITTCFTKLEERILQKLAPEVVINSFSIDRGLSEYGYIAEELKPFYGAASPTGRLSESQPEISGLNTLPQAMRRHGGCAFPGLPTGEEPQLLEKGEQVLTIPGALEWDNPDDGWTENTGSMPVQPNTMVKWRVRGGFGNTPEDVQGPEPASAIDWTLEDEPDAFDIMLWRLAAKEVEEPWIEHTGTPPVGYMVRVDLKYRNGHTLTDVRAGNIDWYNNLSHPTEQDITHWRHAK